MSMASDVTFRDLMRYVHRATLLSDRWAGRWLQQRIGVDRGPYLILRSIEENRGKEVSQQALADHFGLTKAAISRHVAFAAEKGWLLARASPKSRRVHVLSLTPSGRKLVARGHALQREYEQLVLQRVGGDDLSATVRSLRALCETLESEERR